MQIYEPIQPKTSVPENTTASGLHEIVKGAEAKAGNDFPWPLASKLVRFCHLMYDTEPMVKAILEPSHTNFRYFSAGPFAAVGFVLEDHPVIAFRGSQNVCEWLCDFTFLLCGSPCRHLGFSRAWGRLSAQVMEWADHVPQRAKGFVLTGHSLGGALAVLAANSLCDRGQRVEAVVTFGGPRVGAWGFARHYDEKTACAVTGKKLKAVTWRVTHREDLVARVPPVLLGYLHIGKHIYYARDEHLYVGDADHRSQMDFLSALDNWLQPGFAPSPSPYPYGLALAPVEPTPDWLVFVNVFVKMLKVAFGFAPWGILVGLLGLVANSGAEHLKDHYMKIFGVKPLVEKSTEPSSDVLSILLGSLWGAFILCAFIPLSLFQLSFWIAKGLVSWVLQRGSIPPVQP
jgi:pimeloyl-ACP methyl ester carboxylesterase